MPSPRLQVPEPAPHSGSAYLRATRERPPGQPMGTRMGRITSSSSAAIGCGLPVGGRRAPLQGSQEPVAEAGGEGLGARGRQ